MKHFHHATGVFHAEALSPEVIAPALGTPT